MTEFLHPTIKWNQINKPTQYEIKIVCINVNKIKQMFESLDTTTMCEIHIYYIEIYSNNIELS